jgi:hypothetical protein
METLHFEVEIEAPVGVVWNTMLSDETYREWSSVFHEGSYFEGGWATGDAIRFLGPNDDGTVGGMLAFIDVARPEEFVSIEYTGQMHRGVEDFSSDDAKKLIGLHENYTFTEHDGVTTVAVAIDVIDEWGDMFEGMWPPALERLKEIAERAAR